MDSVFGIISLIFWAVTLIVTVKYVLFVMRADNQGEGGIMALLSLIQRKTTGSARAKGLLAGLAVFGAALFFGDSMITPAISVLSAVEGLQVVQPSLDHLVVPITAAIIVFLFMAQRFGTAAVGRMFGPIMIVWFTTIGVLGIRGILMKPEVLKALSPTYAFDFLTSTPRPASSRSRRSSRDHRRRGALRRHGPFRAAGDHPRLAAAGLPRARAQLPGTGRPASRQPGRFDQLAVLPARPGLGPMADGLPGDGCDRDRLAGGDLGAFSIAHQAVQLGYLPRLRVVHTSEHEYGQIYVPWINWALMAAVLTLVFAFQTSAKLAFAYGAAVTGTIAITTVLFFWVVRRDWGRPLWVALLGAGFFLTIELAFLAANLTKLLHGAWVPLLIAVVVFTVMTTWARGRELVTKQRMRAGSLEDFVKQLRKTAGVGVPGTAVFSTAAGDGAVAMRTSVEHLHALHEHVVVLSLETVPVPRIRNAERLEIDELGYKDDGITFVRVKYGYFEEYNVPAAIRLIDKAGIECPLEVSEASTFSPRSNSRSATMRA